MKKTAIYFMPGLEANSRIFEYLSLPKKDIEPYFLNWLLPTKIDESIKSYAQRMCENIHHERPILVGVSFGGIVVQEMSKIIDCKKIIIISSIKSNKELPKSLKLAFTTGIYKLFTTRIIENIESYEHYFFSDYLKKRAELYKRYLLIRNKEYLQWAIYNVLNWQQEEALPNIVHIHGNNDEIFPSKYIENYIKVEKGTHIMILNKAKTISKILKEECLNN